MDKFTLLWTGGIDSTFRLCQLARQKVEVQPVYIIHPGRKSAEKEMETQQHILRLLKKHKNVKARIRPVQIFRAEEIPENEGIRLAYNTLRETYKFGGQYEWLARFAFCMPGVELCYEKYSRVSGDIERMWAEKSMMCKDRFDRYFIDKDKSDFLVAFVWGNYTFPILDYTEQDMFRLMNEWEMRHILDKIWFCERNREEPCGCCFPCRQKMQKGLEGIFSDQARRRYLVYKLMDRFGFGKLYYHLLFEPNKVVYSDQDEMAKAACKVFNEKILLLEEFSLEKLKIMLEEQWQLNQILKEVN